MYHIFCIYSSVDGHLGCFHVLVSTAMNIGMHAYLFKLEFSSFLDICPGVGLLDHMVTLFLVFKEPPYCCPIYIPTNSIGGFLFLHTLYSIYCL